MEYYAGLDVSLRSCAVCVVDGKGTVLHERDLPCEIEEIAGYLTALPVSIARIGFESGTLCQHLFYGLTAEGFDVVCMEARQVSAALSAMRNKTDRNDARGIAQILRTGWFSPVHMKSREAHGVRALLSTRKALLEQNHRSGQRGARVAEDIWYPPAEDGEAWQLRRCCPPDD